jgi:hypothetical protein
LDYGGGVASIVILVGLLPHAHRQRAPSRQTEHRQRYALRDAFGDRGFAVAVVTDWTAGSPSLGNGTVASMPYRNSAGGASQQIGTKVFATNIPFRPGKTVASVTLPSGANQGVLHIFALGTDKGPLTTGS